MLDASGKLSRVISLGEVSDKVAAENKCLACMNASEIMTRELVTFALGQRHFGEWWHRMRRLGLTCWTRSYFRSDTSRGNNLLTMNNALVATFCAIEERIASFAQSFSAQSK